MGRITRRTAIALSGKAVLALAASGPLTRAVLAKETESVSWERFLELCHEMSKSQFADSWDQETYTADIQRLQADYAWMTRRSSTTSNVIET